MGSVSRRLEWCVALCVAECCRVLQCVLRCDVVWSFEGLCCSMLQRVAACCSVLQRVAAWNFQASVADSSGQFELQSVAVCVAV